MDKNGVLEIVVDMLADLDFLQDKESKESLLISVNKLIDGFGITQEDIQNELETR